MPLNHFTPARKRKMKRNFTLYIASIALVLIMAIPAMSAEVAQGKTLKYDKDSAVIVIEEYDINISPQNKYGKSTGKELTFNLKEALIGKLPEPGDIVRIAYRPSGKENLAIRLMNVSKQDIMKK